VLPQWIQTYLLQLQRLRLKVPQWLIAYIQQLQLIHLKQNQRQLQHQPSKGIVRIGMVYR
jgi:hypothetical protein